MNQVIELGFGQMAAAYIFIVILLMIVKMRRIHREKEIIISTLRMTIQLILTGFILAYLFERPHPLYTLIVIALMEVFAIYNVSQRIKAKTSRALRKIIIISMLAGTLSSLLFFVFVVIQVSPWYDPRYFIPIAGMLIGNAMTGIPLGMTRLVDDMYSQRHLIESALMMGASPKVACKQIVDNAFDSAILPTINSMVGMGIVFLPGMMTGQILSGTHPTTAIAYQIAIMLGILGSVALTVILFVQLGSQTFFNLESQLVFEKD